MDTKDAGFMGHKDRWQKSRDKEKTEKPAVLNQLLLGKRQFRQGQIVTTDPRNPQTQKKRKIEHAD